MNRSDDELILFFYGEHEAPEELERALATDAELSRRYAALRRELSALDGLAVPEPRPGLEGRMWARVAPTMARPSRRFALPTGGLAWSALAAAVVIIGFVGFLSGRAFRPAPTESTVAETLKGLPPAARERVLQVALSDHLDSSQRLLLEVANGASGGDDERLWAETLLIENRLYRRAAERAGQRRVAAVLAELEPLLQELADSPAPLDLGTARRRIEQDDLIFKVRVTRNNLKEIS